MRADVGTQTTLADLVERNARLHADDLHSIVRERRLTFAQFAARARSLASALHQLGLRRQDRFAVYAMNCAEFLEAYGAAEVAPFVISPVNFRLAPPEVAYILRDSAPRVLMFERQYLGVVEALRPQLSSVQHYVVIDGPAPDWAMTYEQLLGRGSAEGPPLAPESGDVHCIMYTSGTTGRPKGVMITHAGVLALSEAWALELSADLGHRILLSMPFFHIGARSQGAALTLRGGTMVVHRAFDPKAIASAIQRERITQLHLAPTMLQQVLDLPDIADYDFSSLVTLNYAAAPMPLTTLKRAMRRFGPILINGYGQTEGSGLSLRKAQHRPDGTERELRRLTSVGQPVYDSAVRIVDDEDRDVPLGEVGEICFRSRQVMLGYWNNTAATIEALRGGWLHTGDLGRMDADGFVYLVDRKKDMIVTGGENVYSREVEEAIGSHPAVADVAVIGLPDAKWGEAVTAIVVAKAGAAPEAAALLAHCRTQIAGYKCPKRFDFVAELPRVPSGKVNKVELRNQYKPA